MKRKLGYKIRFADLALMGLGFALAFFDMTVLQKGVRLTFVICLLWLSYPKS